MPGCFHCPEREAGGRGPYNGRLGQSPGRRPQAPTHSQAPLRTPVSRLSPSPRPWATCCHNPAVSAEETEAQRTHVPKVTQDHTNRER